MQLQSMTQTIKQITRLSAVQLNRINIFVSRRWITHSQRINVFRRSFLFFVFFLLFFLRFFFGQLGCVNRTVYQLVCSKFCTRDISKIKSSFWKIKRFDRFVHLHKYVRISSTADGIIATQTSYYARTLQFSLLYWNRRKKRSVCINEALLHTQQHKKQIS